MVIQKITLTHVRVPLVEPFRISSGAIAEKDAIVVGVEGDGHKGYGESSPMSGSFYSADTPESCWKELQENLIPALLQTATPSHQAAAEVIRAARGSNFAKAGLETAIWDLEAHRQGKPLYELLGGTARPIESGLAVGLYDDTSQLLRAIERYLKDGYKRVKIKIEPGRDVELVRAVRQEFGRIPLFVDANGAYDLSHVAVFEQLDEYDLMMYEQPFAASMLREHAELQRRIRTPICLDESLETEKALLRAISLGAMQIANIKIQRVGGLCGALAHYEICRRHRVPVWMGTMPELGIGAAQALAFATLSQGTYPTDVEASARWFRGEIIKPWIEVKDGAIDLPAGTGLGYSVDTEAIRKYTVNSAEFHAPKGARTS